MTWHAHATLGLFLVAGLAGCLAGVERVPDDAVAKLVDGLLVAHWETPSVAMEARTASGAIVTFTDKADVSFPANVFLLEEDRFRAAKPAPC